MSKFSHENNDKILSSGVYPSSWKTSTVLSFPKPGKLHTNPENFRPISLTSCVGKLLEKIINVRLNFFLEHNKCLPPNQFGFRKMHSTINALSKFTSDVSSALDLTIKGMLFVYHLTCGKLMIQHGDMEF